MYCCSVYSRGRMVEKKTISFLGRADTYDIRTKPQAHSTTRSSWSRSNVRPWRGETDYSSHSTIFYYNIFPPANCRLDMDITSRILHTRKHFMSQAGSSRLKCGETKKGGEQASQVGFILLSRVLFCGPVVRRLLG